MKTLPLEVPIIGERRKCEPMNPKSSTPLIEQETSITIDPLTKRAAIYSCVPTMMKKMDTWMNHPDAITEIDDANGIMISVPMGWIKIRPPTKRNYTEEQRAAMAERMRSARKEK